MVAGHAGHAPFFLPAQSHPGGSANRFPHPASLLCLQSSPSGLVINALPDSWHLCRTLLFVVALVLVHVGIGPGKRGGKVAAIGGHPHAARDSGGGAGQHGRQPGHRLLQLGRCQSGEQHKLIPAKAGGNHPLTEVLAYAISDKAQGLITRQMATAVIELLEIIHVDQQQGAFRLPLQSEFELLAIGEPGQLVGIGQLIDAAGLLIDGDGVANIPRQDRHQVAVVAGKGITFAAVHIDHAVELTIDMDRGRQRGLDGQVGAVDQQLSVLFGQGHGGIYLRQVVDQQCFVAAPLSQLVLKGVLQRQIDPPQFHQIHADGRFISQHACARQQLDQAAHLGPRDQHHGSSEQILQKGLFGLVLRRVAGQFGGGFVDLERLTQMLPLAVQMVAVVAIEPEGANKVALD